MSNEIIIRKAGFADAAEAAFLFDQYRMFYEQPTDIKGAKRFISERLQLKDSAVFLAYIGGQAVAFTQLYPIFTSVGMQRSWLLNDLFVMESARGNKVATHLLEAAKLFAKSTNSKWLLLQTADNNFNAQALYEKDGWKKQSDFFYQYDL